MHKDLVLKEQTVLLLEVATENTRIEICIIAIGATILVYVFKILRD